MKYAFNLNQNQAGERVLRTAERIAEETGVPYKDVVWLLTRALSEEDSDSSVYRGVKNLVQMSKLMYSEELDEARQEAELREKYYASIAATFKSGSQYQGSYTDQRAKRMYKLGEKQKVYLVYCAIRSHPYVYRWRDFPEWKISLLVEKGIVKQTWLTKKLYINKSAQCLIRAEMPPYD